MTPLPRRRPHARARRRLARGDAGLFRGFTLDDAGTLAEIRHLWTQRQYLADPHTAVGTAAARALAPEDAAIPVVVAATAHPAKFPDAVERATGIAPAAARRAWPTCTSARNASTCCPRPARDRGRGARPCPAQRCVTRAPAA